MDEYIEREAAINAVFGAMADGRAVFPALNNLPAADVRPVVKAQWVYTDMSRLVCSNCGNPVAFALKKDGWHHGDFCPNCGARMEES